MTMHSTARPCVVPATDHSRSFPADWEIERSAYLVWHEDSANQATPEKRSSVIA